MFISICKNDDACVSGMVAEVKINDRTSAPLWECYHNMSGLAAAIAMQVLSDGVLIGLWIGNDGGTP